MPRVPKYIFCQCMKPWKLCVSKPNSYKLDARDLLDVWSINLYIYKNNMPFNLNYDFINLKLSDKPFVCRFLKPNKSIK
jgi:hypothetical protein